MLDADFDDFDGFDAWARSAAPANHCAYAAQCSGARMPPQGSTDPQACEAVSWCGMRQQLLSGEAEPKIEDAAPLLFTAPPRRASLRPASVPKADWDKLKSAARADAAKRRTARLAAAGVGMGGHRGQSKFAVQWGGALHEWERNRTTYASVADAVRELCDRAPRQWAPAITRMAQLPRKLGDIQRWDGALAATERLAAFDEAHGEALDWVLSDAEIRERANDLAQRVTMGVARIYRAHGVDETAAARARERLAACAEFEVATTGKNASQVRRATGRDLGLWAAEAAMTEQEKMKANELLARLRLALDEAIEYVAAVCERHRSDPPKLKRRPTADELQGAINRTKDPIWWRRTLRRAAARIVEAGAIKLGMVNRRTGGYTSNDAVQRRRQQLARNAAGLASALYKNEAGQIYTLAELAAASVSNPVNRGGELMTRIRGCEEYADAQGHIGLFVTLTSPSAMHPMLSREWRDRGIAGAAADDAGETITDVYRAVKNPRYDGVSTPRDAQTWLVKQFGRARAAMKRVGLQPYGFRVAEPHHDATPHWHMLLWVKTEAEARQLQDLLYKYWVNNDKRYQNERGAAKNRTNFKRLTAGGAAGYIAKYIAKSIGHHALQEHLDNDEAGELMTVELGGEQGHVRVDAWASTWGIRQFQPIGQPSVTVWREVRRVTQDQIEDLPWTTGAQARLAWNAAQKIGDKPADWAGFIRAMGGVCLPRGGYSLQPARRSHRPLNRYGETAKAGRIVGVCTTTGKWLISRRLNWHPVRGAEGREEAEAKARVLRGETPQDETARAAKAAPWTGFNNCTARLDQGRPNWLWKEDVERAEAQAGADKWAFIGRYLRQKHTRDLKTFGATDQDIAQVALLHARELLQRMRWTLPQALRAMETDGWTRGGVATEEALCA